jgi:hypothetical protein
MWWGMTETPEAPASPETPERIPSPSDEALANQRHGLRWSEKTWAAIQAMFPKTVRETLAQRRERERRGDE